MAVQWVERDDGVFFPGREDDGCFSTQLAMLVLDEKAVEEADGIRIPYESLVLLPPEVCESLTLPPPNPYRVSVRADGDLGHSNPRYFLEILQPDGTPFVHPVIRDCLLHIDAESVYRLSVDQYQLVCVTGESNRRVPALAGRELQGYNLLNLARLQRHARATEAKLDDELTEDNGEVIVPDKLDVEFQQRADGEIHVEPILLRERADGGYDAVGTDDFQRAFDRRRVVTGIYRGHNRTRYVCPETVREGLAQVKAVRAMDPREAERYRKQPRELFSGDVFHFGSEDERELRDEGWLPEEGAFTDPLYSDRVKGLAAIHGSAYYGSGHTTDWMTEEGTSAEDRQQEEALAYGADDDAADTEGGKSVGDDVAGSPLVDTPDDAGAPASSGIKTDGEAADSCPQDEAQETPMALAIKANDDAVDYRKALDKRRGRLAADALRDGVVLYDYQADGVAWMYDAWRRGYNGVLLADDMGLGKTLQTLSFIAGLHKGTAGAEMQKLVLIVAPIALQKNWMDEYGKFVDDDVFSSILQLHGKALSRYATGGRTPNGKKKLELAIPPDTIALTTYETLRDYQFSFAEVSWGIIVVDEAQKMKNPSTGITLAIKAMKYDYAICLSGTLVENSWVDLWSIMDFVQPAKLGDLRAFKQVYVEQLKASDGDAEAVGRLGQKLKAELRPLFLRRMKKDKLSGLPEKHVHVCKERMPDYRKRCYLSVIRAAQAGEIHPLNALAALRNISLHPDLATKQPDAFFQMDVDTLIAQSARLIATFKILDEVRRRDEKVLVFLVSKKMQVILRFLIEKKYGIRVDYPINGEMNGAARQRIIDKFGERAGFQVLILSPEAAGVGFTITAANHVIHLSRCWNPAKEDQATDRVYRIGQERPVHVYLPMACHEGFGASGSFDEKLDALLDYKRRLSEKVLFPTGDSRSDGMKLFADLTKGRDDGSAETCLWTIRDLDTVGRDVFEAVVTHLYDAMDGLSAVRTGSNGNGADVVVREDGSRQGRLIRCRHRDDPEEVVAEREVKEIAAAVRYYQDVAYPGYSFQPVVVTNAVSFAGETEDLAQRHGVRLVARTELDEMLRKYRISKKC